MIENVGDVLNEGETVFLTSGLNDKAIITSKDTTSEYLSTSPFQPGGS